MDQEKILEELLQGVENGKKLTAEAERLAKKHGITKSRILSWYYQAQPSPVHHGSCVLTQAQEQQLLYSVISMSDSNLDWTISQTQDFANLIFGIKLTKSSAHRFLQRHREHLTFQKSTSLGFKRTEDGLYESAMYFAEKMERYFEQKHFLPSQIINYDESRVCLTVDGKFRVHRLVSKSKAFVSAKGEVIATYMIFSARFDEVGHADVTAQLPKQILKTRSSLQLSKIFWTDSGYHPPWHPLLFDWRQSSSPPEPGSKHHALVAASR